MQIMWHLREEWCYESKQHSSKWKEGNTQKAKSYFARNARCARSVMLVVNNFSDVSAHFRSVTSQYKQSKQSKESKITDALKKINKYLWCLIYLIFCLF